eukprot:156426_1
MSALLLCVSLLLKISHGLVSSDEIKSLPGYNGTLPSKQYSGMLQVPNTSPQRYYHYWLVTSESNPTSAPVVFWFNGGPGASSMLGYFTEQGPFNLNDESTRINTTSIPVPFYNKYTWAKVSNIIFLESPAGVGFSYCNGPEGPMYSCPDWNDTLVAQDNHAIIQQFFKSYPEYMTNDFYVFGESYAGIYVPTLVMQIEADPSGMPKLIGFGVGDGCLGINGFGGCNKDYQEIFWNFMYGHGQMSSVAYENIQKTCGNSLHFGNESSECAKLLGSANVALGGYNVYNLYDECYYANDALSHVLKDGFRMKTKEGDVRMMHQHIGFNGAQSVRKHDEVIGGGVNDYVCGGERNANIYLNNPEVKKALHVPDIPWRWQDGAWSKYHSTQTDESEYYKEWAKKYRILIYYGDVDAGVPYTGGEEWTTNLGYPTVEAWRPWTLDGKESMAGYVQIFDAEGNNFTYVTVRGAGHMVPQYKPEQALKMYSVFMQQQEWPKYVVNN